jgi:hypothetical protein
VTRRQARLAAPSAFILLALFALAAMTLGAQERPAPSVPFRFERPIVATAGGPHRLAIDVPLLVSGNPFHVLSAARAGADRSGRDAAATASGGLTDLRLFDASGKEVAYLLVPHPSIEPDWRAAIDILPVAPVETENEKTSGFEADLGGPVMIDRFRIDGLSPPYLKRIRLEGSGDRARWTVLVGEGTVFDLPDSRLRQTELSFAAGSYRYLRVTWDDARSARVARPSGVAARETTTASVRAPLTTPVGFERRPSEPGRSRFHVRLPGGRLPVAALVLDVAGGHVLRDAEVYEARLAGGEAVPALIGRGTLKRVEQGALAASALRVPIEAPIEAELDLVVDDGDNPPLDVRGITAEFAELPWIYFEASEGALTARYGNPSLPAPNYDLEAARPALRIDTVRDAAWGVPRPRTADENAVSPVPPLPTFGAPVDASTFRFVRDIPAGDAGLIAVRLDEAALAHSNGVPSRFSDVRVIDADGRQIPYLVERSSEPLSIELSLAKLSTRPGALGSSRASETVYRIGWPYAGLPSPRLVLSTSARVFKRPIRVAVEREPDRRRRDPWIETLGTTTWMHAAQDTPAAALVMSLPAVDATHVLLIVDEGDNTPLPIDGARLLLPADRMRLFREQGQPLRLAYGRTDLAAPSYDLALLAPRVFGVSAMDVAPGPERETRAGAAAVFISPPVFWGILVAAVIVLLGLIARLMRKPTA